MHNGSLCGRKAVLVLPIYRRTLLRHFHESGRQAVVLFSQPSSYFIGVFRFQARQLNKAKKTGGFKIPREMGGPALNSDCPRRNVAIVVLRGSNNILVEEY